MPPVFNPVSPSPMRLWSWARGNATLVLPSLTAMSEHSVPVSRSSSTMSPTAIASRIASVVSSAEFGTTTPFPPASPDCFTTMSAPKFFHHASASASFPCVNEANRGLGKFRVWAMVRAYDLSDSRRASACVGPNAAIPAASNASTSPAASGASGPTTTSEMRLVLHSATMPLISVAETVCRVPGVPALPGVTCRFAHFGDSLILEASACSRAPLPTTKMFSALVMQAPGRTFLCLVAW